MHEQNLATKYVGFIETSLVQRLKPVTELKPT